MCGFGNKWHSLWTNVFIELYISEYSIGHAFRPCVGFKYGYHEDKDIPWVLASRSSIWRDEYDMIKKKKIEFLCGTQIRLALAYVLSHECSRSWVFDQDKNSRYGSRSKS